MSITHRFIPKLSIAFITDKRFQFLMNTAYMAVKVGLGVFFVAVRTWPKAVVGS